MGLTTRKYMVNGRYGLCADAGKNCKARIARKTARYTHHSYRVHSRNEDQLSHLSFKQHRQTKWFFGQISKKKGLRLFGTKHSLDDRFHDRYFDEKFREMTQEQRLLYQFRLLIGENKSSNYGLYSPYRCFRKSKCVSDLCLAAYKQLERRGQMKPFKGHRNHNKLYKREVQLQFL